ncbi:XdhC family protein [Xinfangfangia sp. CPCC 101601]|uniref:XdhC family protein n=1 Tax=Pseudogemmobacter lacusdianii TaxID=3069608 RepID=A0ABU0W299_9RHOB|nr:XdhC/CoxI family protein [Xinfangfangia sp. CPCC 101601]MDQ2068084.1 XdhC family protein [Xinfangfangia sp. CPCC 101601]
MTEQPAKSPDYDSIIETALHWQREGRGAALATVVETWGSAPRQPGSQLAVSGQGEITGSVSGGCVEGAVVTEALEAIIDGQPRLLSFGVSDDSAFSVGLACGGTIRVLVEPLGEGDARLSEEMVGVVVNARSARRPIAIEVDTETWARQLIRPGEDAAADARFRSDLSGMEEGGRFLAIHNPPLRLIIVGAVHIAQALVPMARLAGYDPTVIDPRGSFGAPARFPGERLVDDWPDEALAELRPDSRTAVVTLTHDPKLDDPAILAALASDCFYLGCLGSRRTHAQRLERMENAGIGPEGITRIHAPVGLAIGAKTPAEIAISILAQITQVLRQGG